MPTRVVVAMSGGVDSSLAAALLKEQGYEVIGITMCFGLKESGQKKPSCCGIEGIEDARKVARTLGIKHYVLNFNKYLQEKVINNFVDEYLCGRTPNPCVRCNQYLKFERLLSKAKSLGAKYLATGHYARIAVGKEYLLKKAKDKFRDQSYFLYRLNQEQMSHILMPLGNLTKEEVRRIAGLKGLHVANKAGSQEICFIPDDNYREFLKKDGILPGPILDTKGKLLGQHKGIPFYTIGQREGLGIAMGFPIYIVRIDAKNNTIIVGTREEAFSPGCVVKDLNYLSRPVKRIIELKVKIRYNQIEIPTRVIPIAKNRLKVIFSKPQFAVSPGQSAVFYKADTVIAGGIIERKIDNAEIS